MNGLVPQPKPVLDHLQLRALLAVDAGVALLGQEAADLLFGEVLWHLHGEGDHGSRAIFRVLHQGVKAAVGRVPLHRPAAAAAMECRGAGEQQLYVVVQLAHGAHCGAGGAHRIGLVHQVCTPDELLDRAHGLAAELAEKPPLAVAGVLEAGIQGGELSLEEGLAVEYRAMERTPGSKDTIEGVRAFFEKRKPVFKGEEAPSLRDPVRNAG